MSTPNRYANLVSQLTVEIAGAKANDTAGQFPILDIIGNLRDEAAKSKDHTGMVSVFGAAWDKLVAIVESGQPFTVADIDWLQQLLAQVQASLGGSAATPAVAPAPVPAIVTAPAPAAAPIVVETASAADIHLVEEDPLNINIGDDGELLREFINESREHLDNIEQGVLVLENQPQNAETLNTVFRAFHTFKGGAGFLNLIPINRLAHVLESLLDLARQNKIAIDAAVIELILRGRDVLKQFLDEIEGQIAGSRPVAPITIPTALLKQEVQDMIDGKHDGAAKPVVAPEAAVSEPVVAAPKVEAPAVVAAEEPKETAVAPVAPAPAPAPMPAPAAAGPAENNNDNSASQNSVVKVDTAKLDGLLDLVGEMVIAQSLVSQDLSEVTGLNPQFMRNMAQLSRITRELQRVSMSLRMVPIRGVFNKMSRVVRDIGAKQNKKVQFITSGEDTELDRGVVEELNDPLLHMIRNSMDHGIETADKRKAAGKSPLGTLQLRAYHQGGNIVVEVEDDGAGLSRERILKKAIERGLARPEDQLTDEEVFKFIFAAGFSTAEKITDLSGRGVGLDVVRRNIERLRGRVEIESKLGQGTKFKLSLPLTLAIIDGFI
ncbi:MAG TPA: chemotaxis protein CheA, partial [Verrucomicrobiae bacterium]